VTADRAVMVHPCGQTSTRVNTVSFPKIPSGLDSHHKAAPPSSKKPGGYYSPFTTSKQGRGVSRYFRARRRNGDFGVKAGLTQKPTCPCYAKMFAARLQCAATPTTPLMRNWRWGQSSANLSPLGDFPVKRENTGNFR
jgi:hypothetical protein